MSMSLFFEPRKKAHVQPHRGIPWFDITGLPLFQQFGLWIDRPLLPPRYHQALRNWIFKYEYEYLWLVDCHRLPICWIGSCIISQMYTNVCSEASGPFLHIVLLLAARNLLSSVKLETCLSACVQRNRLPTSCHHHWLGATPSCGKLFPWSKPLLVNSFKLNSWSRSCCIGWCCSVLDFARTSRYIWASSCQRT